HGAGFAGKAVAKCGFHFGGAERVAIRYTAHFERGANGVGASASGHDFLAGRNEGWTHRGGFFAAAPATGALLEVAGKGTVLGGKGQHRCERKAQTVTGTETQVFIDVKASIMNDLARIEEVMRVERRFDFGHHV